MTNIQLLDKLMDEAQRSRKTVELHLALDSDYTKEFVFLLNWLLKTRINPYEFMPKGWEGYKSDIVSLESLCHVLHHAFVDDGNVSFIWKCNIHKFTLIGKDYEVENWYPVIIFENAYDLVYEKKLKKEDIIEDAYMFIKTIERFKEYEKIEAEKSCIKREEMFARLEKRKEIK